MSFRSLTPRLGMTLAQEIFLQGQGLMSGHSVSLRLVPLHDRVGFHMRRTTKQDWTPINEQSVMDTSARTTTVKLTDGPVILVEHLLSALKGMGVDHVGIEISGPEIPIFDGSSRVFAEAILRVGLVATHMPIPSYVIENPISFEFEDSIYALVPSAQDSTCSTWHCVIDYPTTEAIGLQKIDFELTAQRYFEEICSARTFCLIEELEGLRNRGLIKGGSLENALVFDGKKVLNAEGMRFHNEPVRHKLLDLIGDLGLMNLHLQAHITAVKPSHRANNALAKIIRSKLP